MSWDRDFARDTIEVNERPRKTVLYTHDGKPLVRQVGFAPPPKQDEKERER